MKIQRQKNIARRLREIKLLSLEDYTPQSLGSKREFFEGGSVGILFRLLRDHFKTECSFILVLGCQSWNAAHVCAHAEPLKADIY